MKRKIIIKFSFVEKKNIFRKALLLFVSSRRKKIGWNAESTNSKTSCGSAWHFFLFLDKERNDYTNKKINYINTQWNHF